MKLGSRCWWDMSLLIFHSVVKAIILITQQPTENPGFGATAVAADSADDGRVSHVSVGHQTTIPENAQQRCRRVGDPTEGKCHGRNDAPGVLSNGFLHNVGAEEHQHREDIAGVAPLILEKPGHGGGFRIGGGIDGGIGTRGEKIEQTGRA